MFMFQNFMCNLEDVIDLLIFYSNILSGLTRVLLDAIDI
jgi:hypothetical protein